MNQPMTPGATRTTPMASLVARTAPIAALAAVAWAAVSVVVFLPNRGPQLTMDTSYADDVTFLLGLILSVLALTGLQCWQERCVGRLGQVGYWLIIVPFALLIIQTTAELIVGDSLGPLYLICVLLSRFGFILWGIAAYRARVLPRWLGPALALSWFIAPQWDPMPLYSQCPWPGQPPRSRCGGRLGSLGGMIGER